MRTLTLEAPFALFSDVHGNLPGLEAILADIERRGVPATISLGDLVGYGPSPNEVALLVRDRGIPSLMGNYDQGIGFETGDCGCVYKTDEQRAEGAASLAWTQEAVTDEVKAYLRTLEDHFTFATPAGDLLAVHGSPRRINEYLFEDRPEKAMARMADEYPYPAIFFGHTHVPYARPIGETDVRQRRQRRAPQGRRLAGLLRDRRPGEAGLRRLRRVRARPLRLRAAAARARCDAADHELRGSDEDKG